MRIDVGGAALTLLPDRAVLLEDRATLIIADPHFGKAATFRASGIPIPHGTTASDIARLAELVQRTAATQLVILGDFFHAKPGRAESTMAELDEWRNGPGAALDILLVRGNHDHHAGDPPPEWGFRVVSGTVLCGGGLAYSHAPVSVPGRFVLSGHIHPGLCLRDGTGKARVPCFHQTPAGLVLPAFGSFTGLYMVEPADADALYAVAGDAVLPVPRPAARRPRKTSA